MMIRDELTDEGKRFYKEISELASHKVKIGYQRGETMHKSKDGETVDMVDIAATNEFGTDKIPSRPFLRMTVDNNEDTIRKACNFIGQKVVRGGRAKEAFQTLGAFGVSLVQETIVKGSFVPNAPYTIKKKGSSKPLIDTGQMRQSVHFIVVPKEES